MRTQEEIIERIYERTMNDLFGLETSEYIYYLDFDHAKPFLKEGTTPDQWKAADKTPIEKIKDYMPFAWEKANACRGISANRSIMHIIAWLWLAEEQELLDWVEREYENYEFYGKAILEKVCDHFGVDWKALDNGLRTNTDS